MQDFRITKAEVSSAVALGRRDPSFFASCKEAQKPQPAFDTVHYQMDSPPLQQIAYSFQWFPIFSMQSDANMQIASSSIMVSKRRKINGLVDSTQLSQVNPFIATTSFNYR